MKGQHGCWVCGDPTSYTLLAWLRDYRDGTRTAARHDRQQVSIGSIARSLCAEHAMTLHVEIAAMLERRVRSQRGCGRCDARTTTCIQVWRRTRGGASTGSKTTSFCEPCGDKVWEEIWSVLDPDGDYQMADHGGHGAGLAVARARLQAK